MSIPRSGFVSTCALFILLAAGNGSAQSLSLYDNFTDTFVDSEKWIGAEPVDGTGSSLEAVRQLANGKLALTFRARGDRTTDSGRYVAGTGLFFQNPNGISQIVFDAKVPTVTVSGCGANGDPTFGGIQAIAKFYSEDTYHALGGDVVVLIGVGRLTGLPTPANRLEVFGGGVVSIDSSGDEISIGQVDLGTVLRESTVKLSIEWDPSTDEIRFRVNQRPVVVVQGPTAVGTPNDNFKVIYAGTLVENCTAETAIAYAKGTVDNVFIKRIAVPCAADTLAVCINAQ